MAGIISNVDSDVQKLRKLRNEIEEVKKALKGINIKVDVDIAKGMETQLKVLTDQYHALVSKIAEAEGKIMLSTKRINDASEKIIQAQEKILKAAGGVIQPNQSMPSVNALETASIQAQARAYDDLAAEVQDVLNKRELNISSLIKEQKAVELLKKSIAGVEKGIRESNGSPTSGQVKLLEHYNKQLLAHKAALSEVRQVLNNDAKINNAAATSMDALGQSLSKMRITYRGLTEEERNSSFGKDLLASINQTDSKIKALDATIGNHQRNVGNYKQKWDGLGMSIQQIGREFPSLAYGPKVFFSAISNNLPILADEIKRTKNEFKALKAEGKEATPVWKQVASSLFSWNTALTVGITLLTLYGDKVVDWVSGLFKAKDALSEIDTYQQNLNRIMSDGTKNSARERVELDILYKATQNHTKSLKDRSAAADELKKKYPSYFSNLSNETILAGNAASAYKNLTDNILKAAQARAAMKIIEDNYNKIYQIQKAINADTNWTNRNREKTKGGTATESVSTTMSSSAGAVTQTVTGLTSDAAEYNRRTEALKKNKAAVDLLEQSNKALVKSIDITALTEDRSGDKQESAAEKLRKEQEKLSNQTIKNDLSLNAERLAILEDGRQKRLLQSKQEWEEKKAQLDKEYKERLAADKKNNLTTPQEVTDTYKARLDINDKAKEKRDANINKDADKEFMEHQKELTSFMLTEEETRQKAIKERYDKEREWAKEKLDGGDITETQYKEYNVSIDNAESQEILKGLTDEYQDYTDKRLAIETKYNNDIAALDEQRKIAEKKGDTKQVEKIDRAKAQATKEKGKALMGADYEQLKKSPEYVRAFENLKKTSTATLTSLLSQLENAKQTAAEVLAPDELREYTSTIQDVMDELDSRNPFKALADRKKELAEAEEELAIAKKNLETVQSGGKVVKSISYNKDTGETEKIYLSSAEALEKYNKAKDKTAKLDTEVHEAERKVDDVMGELFDSIQNLGSAIGGEAGEIIGVIGDIGQFALMAMNGVESSSKTASAAIQTVEKASVILAIISAAIQVATKIASLFKRTDYMEEFRKEMEKLNYELELAKLNAEISADENSIFGDDLWKNAIKNVELANEAFMKYSDTLDQVSNRRKYTGFMGLLSEINGIKNSFNSLEDSIANMQIQVRHKTWFRSAKYSSLKDAVPELFNDDGSVNMDALEKFIGSDTFKKLSGENQKYLQEMSDYWKSYQEAVEQVKDYLTDIFGDLGNTMSDALVDAFANGTDAAQTFTDSVSDMLETLAKQMIYSVTLGPLMEKAQEEMLGIMKNTSLSEEEKFKQWTDVLNNLVNNAISEQDRANELFDKYQQAAADKGFDIFAPESADSAKEALESFVSDMQSALTSLDVTAKDVSDNIYDYFRQAMINALYEKEYKSKMEELYKSFEDLSADGLSESDMAQLGSQVDQYIEQMMKGVEDVNSLFADKLKDNEDLQSFVDNVKSAMSSIEATAEDVTDNIFEYIRQQMVEKMFADTFQPQIEEFYKRVQEAMSDGSITDAEKDALRSEAEKLANDIVAAKDILSDTLGITSKNLQKELEEEFKSFSDGILSSLYNAEVTAESVAKDIAESMRKELIEAMYIEQYEPRIKAIWEKWKEYSADGLVTDEERANIKADIDELGKEVADAAKEISDAWTDSGEEVKKAFESFSDSIKNVLYDAEATAEDVANNIYQYMRNALVDSMFTAQLKPQIQAWYDKYTEFMADGAIDTAERKTLDEMIAEIQKAGVDIVDAANALFPSLDTGAIKRAEEAAQEAENARNEAEQEWESFSDDILNSLYDIETTAEDISDDMGEYMRKALIKAMYVNNFKPQMQKWYNEWQKAMGDDNLTSEEKQTLDAMKQTMVDDMKKEVDAINQFFGTMYSQQASSKGFEAMSQDTGEELNGRFTALQVAGEEIKNQAVQQTGLLSSINNKLSLLNLRSEDIPALRSGNFNIADRTREVIASGYQSQINVVFPTDDIRTLTDKVSNMERIVDELRTFQIEKFTDVVEGVTKISKNTPQMNDKLDRINENIKRAL